MQSTIKSTILIAAGSLALLFAGCRKGPQDPLFSLRSRNARLTSKWVLKKLINSYTSSNFIQNQVYEGDSLITFSGSSGNLFRTGEPFSYEVEFKEDGGLHLVKNSINTGSFIITAFWNWGNAGKRKSTVEFTSYLDVENGTFPWTITKLSNKELILDYKKITVQISSGFEFRTESISHAEFEKK